MRFEARTRGSLVAGGVIAAAVCATAAVLALRPDQGGGAAKSLQPTTDRTSGQITFAHGGPGFVTLPGEIDVARGLGIVTVDLASGRERPVTPEDMLAEGPAWSPDGRVVAFARYASLESRPAITVLAVRRANGGRVRGLVACRPPACDGDGSPAFSPDGSKLAFRRETKHGGKIFVARADGQAPKPLSLLRGLSVYGALSWSRHGSALAFAAYRHGGGKIGLYVINANGRGVRRVRGCRSGGCDTRYTAAAWSPVRDELASELSSGRGIQLIRADGTVIRSLSDCRTRCQDSAPAWSPDGQYVAFVRTPRRGRAAVYIVGRDGTGLRRVTGRFDDVCCPSWRPAVH